VLAIVTTTVRRVPRDLFGPAALAPGEPVPHGSSFNHPGLSPSRRVDHLLTTSISRRLDAAALVMAFAGHRGDRRSMRSAVEQRPIPGFYFLRRMRC